MYTSKWLHPKTPSCCCGNTYTTVCVTAYIRKSERKGRTRGMRRKIPIVPKVIDTQLKLESLGCSHRRSCHHPWQRKSLSHRTRQLANDGIQGQSTHAPESVPALFNNTSMLPPKSKARAVKLLIVERSPKSTIWTSTLASGYCCL